MIMKPQLGEVPDASQFPMPVGLWLMNERAGSRVNDLSGNGYDLSASGNPTWVPGKFGSAGHFVAASSQYFSRACSPITSLPYTVCCWIKSNEDNPAAARVAFFYGNSGDDADYFEIGFNTAGQIASRNRHTQAAYVTSADDVADGKYHFACVIITDPLTVGLDLYIDGVYDSSTQSANADITDMYDRIAIGMLRDSTPSSAFEGDIDHVMMFPCALTPQQIAQLYRDPFPWFVKDPISRLYVSAASGISMPLVMQQMNQFDGGVAA